MTDTHPLAASPLIRFQALIFDMDGTLTDSESWWDEVRRGLATEDGVPWPATATTDMMGMSTPEWSAYLVETVGIKGTAEDAARRTIDAMADRYHHAGVPLLPGAAEAVARMAQLLPLGLASSSPRRLIDAVCAEMDWDAVLVATVSTEEVERGKPAPDGFLRCCELMGVDAAQSAAVEDSTNGLISALAAGMCTIAVPPRFHPPSAEVLNRADAVIDTLDELTVELLAQL